jgi:hypothetical protein
MSVVEAVSLSVILAVSLYFCRQLASPSSYSRPTCDSPSQVFKSLVYQRVLPQQNATELQIYGFRKFLWNHFSLLFQAVKIWGVSSNAFLISLVGWRIFAALAVFFVFPKQLSLSVIFFFLLLSFLFFIFLYSSYPGWGFSYPGWGFSVLFSQL